METRPKVVHATRTAPKYLKAVFSGFSKLTGQPVRVVEIFRNVQDVNTRACACGWHIDKITPL